MFLRMMNLSQSTARSYYSAECGATTIRDLMAFGAERSRYFFVRMNMKSLITTSKDFSYNIIDKKFPMPMAAMIIIKKKNNAPNGFFMLVPSLSPQ